MTINSNKRRRNSSKPCGFIRIYPCCFSSGHNCVWSSWVLFWCFLAQICIFLSLFKNHPTSKHFCSYCVPSPTTVCFSSVTSPIPLALGDLSRIYSFPMFSYSISCSVWCKTDFKVHHRTEVNMKDSRILAFGFASGLYYYNKIVSWTIIFHVT